MAKKSKKESKPVAELQPDELHALKALVKEFIDKITAVDNEVELLKEDRKELVEEYSEKLDVKTLNAALKYVKIQQQVKYRDTFDMFVETLTDPSL